MKPVSCKVQAWPSGDVLKLVYEEEQEQSVGYVQGAGCAGSPEVCAIAELVQSVGYVQGPALHPAKHVRIRAQSTW